MWCNYQEKAFAYFPHTLCTHINNFNVFKYLFFLLLEVFVIFCELLIYKYHVLGEIAPHDTLHTELTLPYY